MKSFYLTYGAQNVTVDELGRRIAHLLGMQAELRDSLYLGEYVNCLGPQTDKLTIEPDKEGDGTLKFDEGPFNKYTVFVNASNFRGQNTERESRHNRIKEALAAIPELFLLEEDIVETDH